MGDLVTSGLALLERAAKPVEGFTEERFDVVRLQPARFGPFHVLADTVYAACVHRIVSDRALFEEVLKVAAVERMIDGRGQPRQYFRLFAIPYGLDQQLPQRSSFEVQLPQYIEDLPTQGLPRLLQLVEQLAIDIALPRLVRHEIPQVAHVRLANTMNAAEALLQTIGVPRQVVVHHQVSALQVDAFPGGICGKQHVHVGIVPERVWP